MPTYEYQCPEGHGVFLARADLAVLDQVFATFNVTS